MAKKDLLNPRFFPQFMDNDDHYFAWTMNNMKEMSYSTYLEDEPDGNFAAIVLSGTETNESTGQGTGYFDHRLIPSGDKIFLEVKVRRKDNKGVAAIVSDPSADGLTPQQRFQLIHCHEWARSRDPFEGEMTSISPGQEVVCYYEKGSTKNSNFSGLRFVAPFDASIFEQFLTMAGDMPGLGDLFNGVVGTLGEMIGLGGDALPANNRPRTTPVDSITLHYNVGHSNADPQRVYNSMIQRDVAYHVLIGGDGNHINPVPFDTRVVHGHAGNSGVGVCFLNMGWGGSEYQQQGSAKYQKAISGQLPGNKPWRQGRNPNGSERWIWDPFTPAQVQKAVAVCAEICKQYNLDPMTDIYPHSHWSRGKQDVGPMFPINEFKVQVKQAIGA